MEEAIKTTKTSPEERLKKFNQPLKILMMDPDEILDGKRRRVVDPEKVAAVAHSYELQGHQSDPVLVTESLQLLAGDYAVAACRLLGWKVNVIAVPDGEALQQELTRVDTALLRCDLSVLERCELLLERKEIFLELNPSRRHGGDRRSVEFRSSCEKRQLDSSFAADVVLTRDRTKATVEGEARLASRILPEVRDMLRPTWIAQRKCLLQQIAKLRADQQTPFVRSLLENVEEAKSALNASRGGGGRGRGRRNRDNAADPKSIVIQKLESGLRDAGWQDLTERHTVAEILVKESNRSSEIRKTLTDLSGGQQKEYDSISKTASKLSQEPAAREATMLTMPLFDGGGTELPDEGDPASEAREAA